MARDPDRAAARIAAQQHSLITYLQARHRAGLSKRQIQWRVKTKRWRRLHTGVYAAAGARETWQQSLLAAVLAARTETVRQTRSGHRLEEAEDAAASGLSALWQHGCRRMGKPPKHEVLVVHEHRRTVKGTVVHRTRSLPPDDITTVDGIPTLARPRLCVELCGRIPDTDYVATVDELLCGGEPGERDSAYRLARSMLHGRPQLRRLIELVHPEAAADFRSWLERHAHSLLDAARVQPAVWNAEIHDAAGQLIGIGDAVWGEQRVVLELDGLRFHRTPQQRRRDLRKDRRLQSEGWVVLRYTWLDVVETPDTVVKEVADALRRRG